MEAVKYMPFDMEGVEEADHWLGGQGVKASRGSECEVKCGQGEGGKV